MKFNPSKIIITLALFFGIYEASSQTIAVKSFRKLETDQEARITSPKTDQNGKKCAILKVVTSQTGFGFDFGMIGNAIATEQKLGEIWVWVPAGARKITINHQQLGVLRNYPFDIDIEEATVYEMVLTTGKVTTTVEEQIASQWLVINSIPSGADIYIDEQPANQTPYQNELPLGKHSYRISRDMYLPTAGSVILTADKKESLNQVLKPNFGTLNITTSPETGAAVSIDDVNTGKITPCSLEQIKSGEHTVTLRLNMYKTAAEKITMQPGGDLKLPVEMAPTFAGVTINTNPTSDIYIAGERKGSGTWTGRLLPGIYLFEARKDKYVTASEKREVITGQPLNLTLQPIAKTGTLKVMTTPTDASILLDGVNKGTAPATLRSLLVGDYTLLLSLPNYATVTKNITIAEGETVQVNETLTNGRAVTINSEPAGVSLFIDGNRVGITPFSDSLTFGNHTLHIEQGEKKTEKTITIAQTGGETNFALSFGPPSFTETVNGIKIEMVAVKGGTFQMGSNNGYENEKPVHRVTVSDFAIGKYELTQAQWQAVMGNNPSRFKGENLPVEQVRWNDVQEFLQKLNAKTGKSYRLPTEAEWEYAAGIQKWAGTNEINLLGEYVWYSNNSNRTHAVGGKKPNELGLYDMSGNVLEWCSDWYGIYSASAQTNPKGASLGSNRVIRGGSWRQNEFRCGSANREEIAPDFRDIIIGFRLVSPM